MSTEGMSHSDKVSRSTSRYGAAENTGTIRGPGTKWHYCGISALIYNLLARNGTCTHSIMRNATKCETLRHVVLPVVAPTAEFRFGVRAVIAFTAAHLERISSGAMEITLVALLLLRLLCSVGFVGGWS